MVTGYSSFPVSFLLEYFGVIIMNKRRMDILLTVVFVIVFPLIFLSVIGRQRNMNTEISIAASTHADKELYIKVLMEDKSVLDMKLDEYITCVVLREMPAEFEVEALKAQAIVARTYTLRRVEIGSKHKDAAVCTVSSCCQGFLRPDDYIKDGGTEELLNKVMRAVTETESMVIVYNDALIDATYFSCSGGMTEDAMAVWGEDIPYLQSTNSPGEENAEHHIDTVRLNAKEFLQKLQLNTDIDLLIEQITYTDGGGVDSIKICGKEFKGTDVRKKLGLRSTSFVISVVGETVTVTTRGFGHRVGMSQYGADAMAIAGSSCNEILTHYYKGVEIVAYPI